MKKDGVIFWADDVFNTIYDDDGRLAGFAVISRDISQQKQTDEHTILEEAASTQAAILNALPPNIAVLNKKGKNKNNGNQYSVNKCNPDCPRKFSVY